MKTAKTEYRFVYVRCELEYSNLPVNYPGFLKPCSLLSYYEYHVDGLIWYLIRVMIEGKMMELIVRKIFAICPVRRQDKRDCRTECYLSGVLWLSTPCTPATPASSAWLPPRYHLSPSSSSPLLCMGPVPSSLLHTPSFIILPAKPNFPKIIWS